MTRTAKAPVHLWIVAGVSLLWNLMGAYDYIMTETRNASYMAKFDQAQLDYFHGFPAWFVALWAIAVWGGVLGSVLLLMRRSLAVPVFLYSFLSMVITAIYSYGFTNGLEVTGTTGLVFTIVIFLISLGLWLYARLMQSREVLG